VQLQTEISMIETTIRTSRNLNFPEPMVQLLPAIDPGTTP
jgi:hypothetical protein